MEEISEDTEYNAPDLVRLSATCISCMFLGSFISSFSCSASAGGEERGGRAGGGWEEEVEEEEWEDGLGERRRLGGMI